jgi:hypothetical protein
MCVCLRVHACIHVLLVDALTQTALPIYRRV